MIERKYQVFVSSTYEDLKDERREVIQALLELDCIPSGMELFPATDDDQWSLIKRVILDCDYYIVIVGGRYGSISADGISYTEREYDYAVSIGLPVIGFVHKNPASIPVGKSETNDEGKRKLDEFRKKVQKKVCKEWITPADLGSVVSRSLVRLTKDKPSIGWVRGNLVPDEETSKEILKLKKTIEELQAELRSSREEAPQGTENLSQGEDTFAVHYFYNIAEKKKVDGFSFDHEVTVGQDSDSIALSWNNIFAWLAPQLMDEATDQMLWRRLNSYIEKSEINKARKKHEDLIVKDLSVVGEDFDTIKVQFNALGLLRKSEKQRSIKDKQTYWSLTPYGDQLMTRLRAISKTTLA